MQRAEISTMVALLKRSDAALWRFHFGDDWATFAAQLGQHHCFNVDAVLVAPSVLPGAAAIVESAVQALGTHQGNGWFVASPEQAVSVLLHALPSPIAQPLLRQGAGDEEPAVQIASMETDEPLLEICEPCTTREASKAIDIRAALDQRVGKEKARELLSKVQYTVAQDQDGHKNKVMRLGGSLLKLRA